MANETLNLSYTELISDSISQIFTDIVMAILILILGFIIGRILGKVAERFLKDIGLNKFLKKQVGTSFYLEQVLTIVVSYGVYIIAIILALNSVGLTVAVITFLSAMVILIIALFILLAVKDFVPNLFAGFYIHSKKRIKEGMMLTMKHASGKIVKASLLETCIITKKEEELIIPNVLFLNLEYKITKK
ncbi:MAG: mechanosensitive ion channel domain-containing protein [Nanoarchaeota archaeon]